MSDKEVVISWDVVRDVHQFFKLKPSEHEDLILSFISNVPAEIVPPTDVDLF